MIRGLRARSASRARTGRKAVLAGALVLARTLALVLALTPRSGRSTRPTR